MNVTPAQKKWAVGGMIAAVSLAVGYMLFHSRPAYAGFLPAGQEHPGAGRVRPKSHRKHPHAGDHGEHTRENGRGEYGRKHHHRGRKHE